MARGVNKVILLGNVGGDPESRDLAGGGIVVNFTLATSEQWKDKHTNEKKEKTEWHRCVVFGKLAEITAEYVRKGSQVYLEGKLQTREWEKDGIKRYTTEILIDQMQMVGGKSEGSAPKPKEAPKPAVDDDDGIPF